MNKISYKDAGVNIDAGNEAVARIKKLAKATYTPNVLSNIGGFASCFDLKQLCSKYEHPVLVQSIDGVGTKTIIARMMNKYDTLGFDLVSATANDILACGAKPLTLLDYIASDKIKPAIIEQIISGMSKACQACGISLVGGETAEMPDTYLTGEHDLVGIVTGIVDKNKIITGKDIKPGDVILGLPSSGLHTNGYSLARKLFFDVAKLDINSKLPELDKTLGETLLEPHINYVNTVLDILSKHQIKGMAHITGGGLIENIPRILPVNCQMQIDKDSWQIPPIFKLMQQIGNIDDEEMYRTFNMGIGFVLIAERDQTLNLQLPEIGTIVEKAK